MEGKPLWPNSPPIHREWERAGERCLKKGSLKHMRVETAHPKVSFEELQRAIERSGANENLGGNYESNLMMMKAGALSAEIFESL